eukprot:6954327-Pyramimonas_sp.AAC.1
MANVMALSAAYPGNAELEALKNKVAQKHVCRRKWKDLCLPERNGSREKLMLYLNERAEAAENSDEVRALVRAIISLFSLVGKRYTSLLTGTAASAAKSELQRVQLMPFAYHVIKAFKHRSLKPTAAVGLDTQVLLKDFGVDLILGQATMIQKALFSADSAGISPAGSGLKRPAVAPAGGPEKIGRATLPGAGPPLGQRAN